ncbi:uncharacterized protein [Panulirus ornatus]|uniref:uncharacterized protein isoform X1 n=1 Tax=Panulirus ornatus TaxID=150431 RepID=UPI003A88D59A
MVMLAAAEPLGFIQLPTKLHCPLPNSVGYKCENVCDVDDDCEVDQYCCLVSCGKTCIQRYQGVQSLNCPAPNPLKRCYNFSHECNNDQECSKDGRRGYCCLEPFCGRSCKEGTRNIQSPECPPPFSFGIKCLLYQDKCVTDQECISTVRGTYCCLVAGCGRTCV